MDDKNDNDQLVQLAADIVSAYVSNNPVRPAELPALIGSTHRSLSALTSGSEVPVSAPLAPAVPIRKSVTSDFIVSLEDGKKYKSLKRHLAARYGMTPDQYRAKWKLPADYPMVAPAYAARRSELAKKIGLGRNPREEAAPAPAKRGRPKGSKGKA